MEYKEIAEKLWALLDDIDTIDDWAKGNEVAYRRNVRRKVGQRFNYMKSFDGQTLVKTEQRQQPTKEENE